MGYGMSGMFSDREKAFEDKWAHDEEVRFKVLARRNKLLGLWAAGERGLKGDEAEAYARAVVDTEVSKDGDEAVFRKLKADFAAAGVHRTDHLIRVQMDTFLAMAKDEVMNGD
jgi:hypothetical protein